MANLLLVLALLLLAVAAVFFLSVGAFDYFLDFLDGVLLRGIPIAVVYLLWRAVRALEQRNR